MGTGQPGWVDSFDGPRTDGWGGGGVKGRGCVIGLGSLVGGERVKGVATLVGWGFGSFTFFAILRQLYVMPWEVMDLACLDKASGVMASSRGSSGRDSFTVDPRVHGLMDGKVKGHVLG